MLFHRKDDLITNGLTEWIISSTNDSEQSTGLRPTSLQPHWQNKLHWPQANRFSWPFPNFFLSFSYGFEIESQKAKGVGCQKKKTSMAIMERDVSKGLQK